MANAGKKSHGRNPGIRNRSRLTSTNAEEQGLAQVATVANLVDVWWNSNNKIMIMRCWRNFWTAINVYARL